MTREDIRLAVFQTAESQEAPTWMIFRQVEIESNFNNAAVSATGALGICQILPSTAAEPGYGVEPITEDQILDPVQATRFLCRYLDALRVHVGGGKWSQALLHYNVGPAGDVATASSAYRALAAYVAEALVES